MRLLWRRLPFREQRTKKFFASRWRAVASCSPLDADFANVMRFPPEKTLGVVRLKVHPATEERIRQAIRRALFFLHNLDVAGRLVVVDDEKIRIRG